MDERRKDNTPGSITAQVRRGVPGGLYVHDNVRAAEPDIACRYAEALSRCIADERMAVYRGQSQGRADDAVRLYLWDRDVSNAVLRDLALVELALRNSIETQLRILLGDRWFESSVFATQSRLSRGLHMAKTSLASRAKDVTGSSLTAELTLGFWVNLFNSYFDSLWRAGLHRAFPGGRRQAGMAGERYGRSWVLSQLQVVRQLRNRCAHQEPLVRGFPMPNVRHRLDVGDGVAAYMRVAAMLDRDLARFMGVDSTVPRLLARRPVGRQ